ncbi:MAG: SUMF1/EgtB/PvdO family nonheme iron enzyme [Phycisphaerae bacterium]|nr:SUMF1/EgtB/PvdO family nonheme iron enzyme [Phycisphaerae bacterium]
MNARMIAVASLAATLLAAGGATADVCNMGPGLTSLETVPVGNPGNAGELSGTGAGGFGPDRICGAVSYPYRIGKYEVTAGQYTEFLNKVAGVDTYSLYNTDMWSDSYGCRIERYAGSGTQGDPWQYRVGADWANRPVNYVSFWDACRFANWLHNDQPTGAQDPLTTERGAYTLDGYNGPDGQTIGRNTEWKWAVTSEDEWYKAAYHKKDGVTGNYFDYPTSTDAVPSNALVDPDPGNNATFNANGYTIGSPYYRTEAGAHENSDSPYGTFDQGGNDWEYNEAIVYQDATYAYRGLRGGSFGDTGYGLHAASRGDFGSPTGGCYWFGFRVSEVPEPLTIGVLAFGGAGLLMRRKGFGR